MTVIAWTGLIRTTVADLLDDARARTLLLVSPLSPDDLRLQHDSLMSPILWDLGHIAHFEELWLTKNLDGPIEFVEMPGLFNPFEHPRSTRGALPIPSLGEIVARMGEIRRAVLQRLDALEPDADQPLLRDGYVYRMVAQHEHQHNETILATLQLKTGAPVANRSARPLISTGPSARMLRSVPSPPRNFPGPPESGRSR